LLANNLQLPTPSKQNKKNNSFNASYDENYQHHRTNHPCWNQFENILWGRLPETRIKNEAGIANVGPGLTMAMAPHNIRNPCYS
jgi:hypothetical protein